MITAKKLMISIFVRSDVFKFIAMRRLLLYKIFYKKKLYLQNKKKTIEF
jgi:hypothetical protein